MWTTPKPDYFCVFLFVRGPLLAVLKASTPGSMLSAQGSHLEDWIQIKCLLGKCPIHCTLFPAPKVLFYLTNFFWTPISWSQHYWSVGVHVLLDQKDETGYPPVCCQAHITTKKEPVFLKRWWRSLVFQQLPPSIMSHRESKPEARKSPVMSTFVKVEVRGIVQW